MYESQTYILFAILAVVGYYRFIDQGGDLPQVTETIDLEYDYVVGEYVSCITVYMYTCTKIWD